MNKQSFLSILAASVILASCGNKNDQSTKAEAAAQIKEYKTLTLQPQSATLNTDYQIGRAHV